MLIRHLERHTTAYALFVAALTLVLDYICGPYIRFPILLATPVMMASWYRGRFLGFCLVGLLPMARLGRALYQDFLTPWRRGVRLAGLAWGLGSV
jgi:hypothetical protein